jgi:hypothetical protein
VLRQVICVGQTLLLRQTLAVSKLFQRLRTRHVLAAAKPEKAAIDMRPTSHLLATKQQSAKAESCTRPTPPLLLPMPAPQQLLCQPTTANLAVCPVQCKQNSQAVCGCFLPLGSSLYTRHSAPLWWRLLVRLHEPPTPLQASLLQEDYTLSCQACCKKQTLHKRIHGLYPQHNACTGIVWTAQRLATKDILINNTK